MTVEDELRGTLQVSITHGKGLVNLNRTGMLVGADGTRARPRVRACGAGRAEMPWPAARDSASGGLVLGFLWRC